MRLFGGKRGGDSGIAHEEREGDQVVAIDLGSSTLRIVAGEVMGDGRIRVVAREEHPSAGIVGGAVSNLSALENALAGLINDFTQKHGIAIRHCYIGVAGCFIEARNERGSATVLSQRVSEEDRQNAIENAAAVVSQDNYHLIHILPQVYEVENSSEVIDPVGLSARRVQVRAHIIFCDRNHESNLKTALSSVSPDISAEDGVVYSGLAAADAVLTESEKDIGVCVINLGDSTVDVTVYERGRILFSFGMRHGGRAITRSIAEYIGIPLQDAESVKVEKGAAQVAALTEEERVSRYYTDERKTQTFTLVQVSDIIRSALVSIFNTIIDHISRYAEQQNDSGTNISLGAGFVLTGGVARTRGIVQLAESALSPSPTQNVKVRVGVPRAIAGDEDMVAPEYAVVAGLLRAGRNIREMRGLPGGGAQERKGSWFQRMVQAIKDEL
ncbi:MAG: cell division protein FtsA [Succinivibrionaceae bacterium]|nr:cell division protein FtsA [Succinivibrionaceae bacterium]